MDDDADIDEMLDGDVVDVKLLLVAAVEAIVFDELLEEMD